MLADIHLNAIKLNIDDEEFNNIVINLQSLINLKDNIPTIIKKECDLLNTQYMEVDIMKLKIKEKYNDKYK